MIFKIFEAVKNSPSLNHFIYFHDPVPAEDDGGSHGQGEDKAELLLVFSQKREVRGGYILTI